MFKRVLIILTTGASCFCTYSLTFGEFQASDSGFSAFIRLSLKVMSGIVVVSTLILWTRQRWVVPITVVAHGLLGAFWATVTFSVIRSGNYEGFLCLAALFGLLAGPTIAAVFAGLWGHEFCWNPRHV